MNWHFSPTIVEWERVDSTEDLVKIGKEDAHRLIDEFRRRWGASAG